MKINANGTEISVILNQATADDYISLTDIAKKKNPDDPRIVISNWMSSYSTIDFLATWEHLYNPNFNRMEFQTVRSESGRLIMTPKQWIDRMGGQPFYICAGDHRSHHVSKEFLWQTEKVVARILVGSATTLCSIISHRT